MVSLAKIILLIAMITFSFPLLDVQAKGGGKSGRGIGKDSGGMMNSGSCMGGNINQQGKGNGQMVRDGSCENNIEEGKGSGKQIMNENNNMSKKGNGGNRPQ